MRKFSSKEKQIDLYDLTDFFANLDLDYEEIKKNLEQNSEPEESLLPPAEELDVFMRNTFDSSRPDDDVEEEDGVIVLMNISTKINGILDRVDTYIGVEGESFLYVASAEDLSTSEVKFDYDEYMSMIANDMPRFLAAYFHMVDYVLDSFDDVYDEDEDDEEDDFDLSSLFGGKIGDIGFLDDDDLPFT